MKPLPYAYILPTITLAGCLLISFYYETPRNSARKDRTTTRSIKGGPQLEGAQHLDGPPPFGQRRMPGGNLGGVREEIKLVKQFDKNNDRYLDVTERQAARDYLRKQKVPGQERPGHGFPERNTPPESPAAGPKVSPKQVPLFPNASLYDPLTLRTIFLDFENSDWESELNDFYHTDVEVPARLTVDGESFEDVGVHFRGATSFFMVREGRKRSFNIALDFLHENQQLHGYRTLNLLNSFTDPTFLRAVLYYQIARDYIPAPKANYVRLVINGEYWGVYVNVQQFNKDFVKDWSDGAKGARWKVPGSPRGKGNLAYLGDDPVAYKRIYELKTKDNAKSWAALIRFCHALNETPTEQLEQALAPLLDIEGALKFLALENVLINNDGYWIRASDYNLYQDEKGLFHMTPYDANETFRLPEGPVRPEEFNGKGVALDPLTGADDPEKPLIHKLLAVPSLRERYLTYIRQMTEKWLDWNRLGPIARQYQQLIAEHMKTDVHKLYPFESFAKGITDDIEEQGFRGPRQTISLKRFVEERRAYLLNHPAIKTIQRSE